jgi:hypothetical protein
VIEDVGGGGRAKRVGAHLEANGISIAALEYVHTVGGYCVVELAGAVVADGEEEGAFGVGGVPGFVVGDRRGLAFVAIDLPAFDSLTGFVGTAFWSVRYSYKEKSAATIRCLFETFVYVSSKYRNFCVS